MAWNDERVKTGRRLFRVVDLVLDFCDLTYSNAPCTAVLGTTGDRKCYNSRGTCQDTANYAPSDKTYRFCDPVEGIPRTFDAIPSLRGVTITPTVIDPGRSLGKRASIELVFRDHPHHDRGIDKYVDERISGVADSGGVGHEPFETGTFFGKLRARNPHYAGRLVHVYTGFLPWDRNKPPENQPAWTDAEILANLRKRTYVQDKWDGPDAGGVFRVTAKDIIKLADDERAVAPVPTTGRLSGALAAGGAAATLVPAGVGDLEYAASGTVLIGSESILFTRAGDVLTLTQRGADGTTDASHAVDDSVQQAKRFTSIRVDAIIQDLLENFASVPAAFVPIADWQAEADDWLSSHIFSTVVWKPTGVRLLVNEICQQALLYLWWDDVNAEIKLRAVRPAAVVAALTDAEAVVENSASTKDRETERLTRVSVFFALRGGQLSPTGSESFAQSVTKIDADAEDSDTFGDLRLRTVLSRWLSAANRPQAAQLALRLLARYSATPFRVTFLLDAKDAQILTGDIITLATRSIQDVTGAAAVQRLQVLEVQEQGGGGFRYTAEADQFGSRRYGFIGPDTLADHGAESEANKDAYAWIAAATEVMADGSEAYRII